MSKEIIIELDGYNQLVSNYNQEVEKLKNQKVKLPKKIQKVLADTFLGDLDLQSDIDPGEIFSYFAQLLSDNPEFFQELERMSGELVRITRAMIAHTDSLKGKSSKEMQIGSHLLAMQLCIYSSAINIFVVFWDAIFDIIQPIPVIDNENEKAA